MWYGCALCVPVYLIGRTGEANAGESLRYIGFSHYEADECGSLNEFLELAPQAEPLCSQIAKMVSVDDIALRPARALADGEELSLGSHVVRWIDTPHLPHAWECGHLHELATGTLFCGDLFTQGGADHPPVTEADILGPSERMRARIFRCFVTPTGCWYRLGVVLARTSGGRTCDDGE